MSSANRIWAVTLGLAAMIAASQTFLGSSGDAADGTLTRHGTGTPAYIAIVTSDWLPAGEARLQLEARTVALEAVIRNRGSDARVVDTRQRLRTRSESGARLEQPLAHLERTLEITDVRDEAAMLPEELRALNVALVTSAGGR